MAISAKAMFDMDEAMLKSIYRSNTPVIRISQDDILRELDRRASRRQALASFVLSVVGVVIALIALLRP